MRFGMDALRRAAGMALSQFDMSMISRPLNEPVERTRWVVIGQRVETTKSGHERTVTRVMDRRWWKPRERAGWRHNQNTNLMKRHLRGDV